MAFEELLLFHTFFYPPHECLQFEDIRDPSIQLTDTIIRFEQCCKWCHSTLGPTFVKRELLYLNEEVWQAFVSFRTSVERSPREEKNITLVDLRKATGHWRVHYSGHPALHQFYADMCIVVDQLIKRGYL